MFHTGGSMLCESPDMKLIDNQITHFIEGIRSIAPVKIVLDHPGMIQPILLLALSPDTLSCHCPGIRIQKHMLFVKQQPFLRIPGAVQPVGILKFLYIQPEYNHGIDLPDPVMIRKP